MANKANNKKKGKNNEKILWIALIALAVIGLAVGGMWKLT